MLLKTSLRPPPGRLSGTVTERKRKRKMKKESKLIKILHTMLASALFSFNRWKKNNVIKNIPSNINPTSFREYLKMAASLSDVLQNEEDYSTTNQFISKKLNHNFGNEYINLNRQRKISFNLFFRGLSVKQTNNLI